MSGDIAFLERLLDAPGPSADRWSRAAVQIIVVMGLLPFPTGTRLPMERGAAASLS